MALGAYVQKFTDRLDKVVERASLTSDLNLNRELLGELNGAGEIKIAKVAMSGLGDYSRSDGFAAGTVTTDWETMKLVYDRGREFEVDAMDDEERAKVLSANLMNEFTRTKVVPEVDAVRFAKLSQNAGTTKSESLTAASGALDAVLAGEQAVEDAGSNLSSCVLYVTSAVKGLLRKAQEYRLGQGENPNGRFTTFDDMKVVTVPTARFYSIIDLYDGKTTGETDGGYVKHAKGSETGDVAGVGINFLIVDPAACAAIAKHEKLRYFAPEVNQDKDAHKWQYRLFHDLLVYENKKSMIYASLATA